MTKELILTFGVKDISLEFRDDMCIRKEIIRCRKKLISHDCSRVVNVPSEFAIPNSRIIDPN